MREISILIVDDERLARELVAERLRAEGYLIETAANGMEAMEKASTLTPDLVLLDIMMPGMDGFEVCRRLRADPILGTVPVILLTALDDRDSRVRGLQVGADDFITKPFDAAELRARVGTIARLDRYRRLHAERLRFEWVVENSEDGYLVIGEKDLILYANSKAREFLGLSQGEEIVDVAFVSRARELYRCEPEAAWAEWPKIGSTQLYLLRPAERASAAYWLSVSSLELPTARSAGLLIQLRDETQNMSLSHSLWKFGSLVAHRFQAPLTFLLESLRMAVEDTERLSKEEVIRLAALALRSGERLEHNVSHILELLETSESPMEEPLSLDRIEALMDELSQALELGAIFLRGEQLEGRIPFSPVTLELILRQIFENALRLHPEGIPKIAVMTNAEALHGELQEGRQRLVLRIRIGGLPSAADDLDDSWVQYRRDAPSNSITQLGMTVVGPMLWSIGGDFRLRRSEQEQVLIELVIPLLPPPESA